MTDGPPKPPREMTDEELDAVFRLLPRGELQPYIAERTKRARIAAYRKRASIPRKWKDASLSKVRRYDHQKEALSHLHRLQVGGRGAYLCGLAGVGKTLLAAAFANDTISDDVEVRYLRWPGLINDQKRRMDGVVDSPDLLEVALTIPVLVLDDLGAGGRLTEWSVGLAEQIMAVRIEECLLTVITSNLWPTTNPGGFPSLTEKMSSRVSSRLVELCRVLVLDGPDLRLSRRPGTGA